MSRMRKQSNFEFSSSAGTNASSHQPVRPENSASRIDHDHGQPEELRLILSHRRFFSITGLHITGTVGMRVQLARGKQERPDRAGPSECPSHDDSKELVTSRYTQASYCCRLAAPGSTCTFLFCSCFVLHSRRPLQIHYVRDISCAYGFDSRSSWSSYRLYSDSHRDGSVYRQLSRLEMMLDI
jgi:hypothetical protein